MVFPARGSENTARHEWQQVCIAWHMQGVEWRDAMSSNDICRWKTYFDRCEDVKIDSDVWYIVIRTFFIRIYERHSSDCRRVLHHMIQSWERLSLSFWSLHELGLSGLSSWRWRSLVRSPARCWSHGTHVVSHSGTSSNLSNSGDASLSHPSPSFLSR
jgi:hypothetical protein